MSAWSTIEGVVATRKIKGISLSTLLKDCYDEAVFHIIEQKDYFDPSFRVITFEGRISTEGEDAWNIFKDFRNKIKSIDPNARITADVNIPVW